MSTVLISRGSKEVVFSGNLLKAPPLDRRGRKKWHQRYIVLRANKTLECHKSQKAASSSKLPRRVIDLRECISLELGLEYKDLQHVLCLGTFKRSFFFAAPSDAMMLQWSNVLESVKNAGEGEAVEILDIGLRKSQNCNAVHRVKPSTSMQRLSTGSNKHLNLLLGVHKSTSNITFTLPDTRGNPSVEVVPDPPPRTSSLRHSSASSTGSLPRGSTPEGSNRLVKFDSGSPSPKPTPTALELRRTSIASPGPTSITSPGPTSITSPGRERSRSVCSNHSTSNPTTPTGKFLLFPARVPPPLGVVATKVDDLKEQVDEGPTGGDHVTTGGDHVTTASVPERRGEPHESATSGAKEKLQKEPTTTTQPQSEETCNTLELPPQGAGDAANSKFLQRVNAFKKRSPPKLDRPDTSVVLQSNMKTSFRYKKIAMRPEEPLFNREGDSSDEDAESVCSSGEQVGGVVIDEVHLKKVGPNFEAKVPSIHHAHKMASVAPGKVQYRVRSNSYSKVTMTSVTQEASLHYPQRVNAPPTPTAASHGSEGTPCVHGIGGGARSCESGGPSPSSPGWSGDVVGHSPIPAHDQDLPIPTPTPVRRKCFSTNSLNSLDAVDVEPPEMFKQASGGGGADAAKEATPPPLEGSVDGDLVQGAADRRSVESSDTGYTSGVSPAALHDVKEMAALGRVGSKKMALGRAMSGDGSKLYVPMVFFLPAVGKDRNLFAVQVCLVECNDGLIKDLILFKALHNYQFVHCDEQEDEDLTAVTTADSFTIETSLEDLEFGFGIVSNTQKDMFDHRVREFHFEVRDLFKTTQKSFSCDVWIKYAGHITKLPIEVQRTTSGQ